MITDHVFRNLWAIPKIRHSFYGLILGEMLLFVIIFVLNLLK